MYIKNTKELFKKLNITKKTLTNRQKFLLKHKGFLILNRSKVMKSNLKAFQEITSKLIKKESFKGGWEGKEKFYKKGKYFEKGTDRLGNLIEKDLIFKKLITIPEILAAAHEVIKGDIKICGLNLRSPLRGKGNQHVHIDWKPRKNLKEKFAGIVCMIYLDKSTKKNGATRIVPSSHKKIGWPSQHINVNKIHKNEIRPELKPGSIIIANLNLWHAGAENLNGKSRKMIMLNIKRRSFPQLLNYKKYLSFKTKKGLNSVEKYLLAVRKQDKTQKSSSVGVGKYYIKDFGEERAK